MYEKIQPTYGSLIRVNRGLYSHHGIYIDDNHIIHFASLKPGHELDPEEASVVETDLATFLRGGQLEVRVYTDEEKRTVKKPSEIVNCAYARLGEKGYNLVSNNCEHFVNECAFGKKESGQVNQVLDFLASIFTK